MESRENRWPWWVFAALAALLLVAGSVIGRTLVHPRAAEPVFLPPDTVRVEVVPQSFLDAQAASDALNSQLRLVNGDLRTENGRLVRIVEHLRVGTVPSPPPDPIVVDRIIREACDEGTPLTYRASLDAFKFEGLDDDGVLSYGWRGTVSCEVSPAAPKPQNWAFLARSPFSLSEVQAETSAAPEPARRPSRYTLGIHYGLLDSATHIQTSFDTYVNGLVSISPDRFRIFGARIFFPKSRHPIGLGVYADPSSTGLHLSYSF